MIIVVHQHTKVVRVVDEKGNTIELNFNGSIGEILFTLAETYTDQLLVWCNEAYFEKLVVEAIPEIFQHSLQMASYSVAQKSFLPGQIGYVEDSPFLQVKYNVTYPTWCMSSDVGGMHSSVLNTINSSRFNATDFDYFLNSIAKICQQKGLLCYSEPRFLSGKTETSEVKKASKTIFFKFVHQHYKTRWMFLALANILLFEKKIPLFSFLRGFFSKKITSETIDFKTILLAPKERKTISKTIDVIIPTMGRKLFLYDVLKDLSKQTIVPSKVIIVEQNPEEASQTELDYLKNETWPFTIIHKFIHQTGACNARNIAIQETTASWVFMADDDIRFSNTVLEEALQFLETYQCSAVTLSCLQKNEKPRQNFVSQWRTFGSGCSIVSLSFVTETMYNLSFEHGYGEDMDYGMQLRNKGCDVLYNPSVNLTHLKAPVGGFRKPIEKPWQVANEIPKPSPTIMLFRRKHTTERQLKGYKLLFFIRYYRKQNTKNPIAYFKKMQSYWNTSIHWSKKLDSL
ncbi:glycosyltransferase family 2 protein [Ulvibacter litoralis]|uniref:Glycosyl transferase family 2 n=1 Tax=Ulvibacter litoralis TaxID=227084 RepID=A0A1G7GW35_9FLAO|nr:glycosyltransferase family 2 protein [Ulvibacter litoralis]GHC59904.1 glycosyl transferase [Ulvibacter litoralis]SDE92380.1 Glycosyl transferase family 2 [Ulvibacter litoralis]